MFVITGNPITKKNSQQIFRTKTGRPFISPSKAYKKYEKDALKQIEDRYGGFHHPLITTPVNIQCVFYMQTKRSVDLPNLLESVDDILVKSGVIEDDASRIVAAHDGSRVKYDKENPRVEITIEGFKDD